MPETAHLAQLKLAYQKCCRPIALFPGPAQLFMAAWCCPAALRPEEVGPIPGAASQAAISGMPKVVISTIVNDV